MSNMKNRAGTARAFLAGLVIVVGSFAGQPALGQESAHDGLHDVDIPAQPLPAALVELSRQTSTQIYADGALVSGIAAPAVAGRLKVQEALDRLLRGSGLASKASGTGLLVQKASPRSGSDAELPTVSVESTPEIESPIGPDAGYVARHSLAATKTDTPLLETPRSISVVTAAQIDDQKVDEIGAALRYTPGVFAEHRGADTSRPNLVIRGFRDLNPLYVDGLQGFSSSFNSSAPEVYGLERLEVLRGPASSLYGTGSPGGIVNGVTKRPREEFFAEVEGSYGSYDQVGGKFDIGGAIDEQKKFLFRLTGVTHGGDTQINHLEDDRLYIAPAFTWKIGDATTLTLLAQYQKDDTYEVQLLPAAGTVLPNPNGTIPTSFLVAEPGYTAYQKESTALGYLFEHKFSDTIALRQSLRQEYRDLLFRTQGGNGYLGDLRTLDRGVFTVQDDVDALTTDTSVQIGLETGAIRHTLLLGVDYKRATTNEDMFYIDGPDIDVFNPIYGQAVPVPPQDWDQQQKLSQAGIYLQDQMKFSDKVVLTLGGRSDRARIRTMEIFSGTNTDETHDALTWQGGLVYLFGNGVAPYVSYAESFEPAGGTDRNGSPFDPTTGTQPCSS
jgi:iron complex outermembrane receptor protein